jgi:DNA-binding GntR family transcriptional regulator
LIDSAAAYGESYQLRQVIEPAGLRAPGFNLDRARLAALRRQQELVRDGGWKTLGGMELFETNAAFHEGLAAMSGNRFLLATLRQLNQLRRLVEYRQTLNRQQVRGQNAEHLHILDALVQGYPDTAADLLSRHLDDARRRKARAAVFKAPFET